MITLLYFLAGYLLIGFLIGRWMQRYIDDPLVNESKLSVQEVMVLSTLCWLPLFVIGLLFPNIFEEK